MVLLNRLLCCPVHETKDYLKDDMKEHRWRGPSVSPTLSVFLLLVLVPIRCDSFSPCFNVNVDGETFLLVVNCTADRMSVSTGDRVPLVKLCEHENVGKMKTTTKSSLPECDI